MPVASHKPCMIIAFGPNGEVCSVLADKATQERREGIRQLILAKEAKVCAHEPNCELVEKGSTAVLRGEPELFDIAAWRARLNELGSDDPSEYRDVLIAHTEAHIRAIDSAFENSPQNGLESQDVLNLAKILEAVVARAPKD